MNCSWTSLVLGLLLLLTNLHGQETRGQETRGQEAGDPLRRLPGDAKFIVHVRGPNELRKKVVETITKTAPPFFGAQLAMSIEANINLALNGRELDGIRPDGHVFLIANEYPELPLVATPKFSALVQVDDFASFRDGILHLDERDEKVVRDGVEIYGEGEQVFCLVESKGYAIVSTDEAHARALAAAGSAKPALADKLDAGQRKQFLEADVGAYFDLASANAAYGAKLFELRQSAKTGMIENSAESGITKEQMAETDELMDALLQAFRDGKSLLISAALNDGDVAVHVDMAVAPASKTSRLLVGSPPMSLDGLARFSSSFASLSAVKRFENPELGALIEKGAGLMAFLQWDNLGPNRKLLGEAGESATLKMYEDANHTRGITVFACADPGKMLEAFVSQAENFTADEVGSGKPFKGPPEVVKNALAHRGINFHKLTVEYDLSHRKANPLKTSEAAAERQLGGARRTTWVGVQGKFCAAVIARDEQQAKTFVDRWLDKPQPHSGLAGYDRLRKHLPEKANVFVLAEATADAQFMFDRLSETLSDDSQPTAYRDLAPPKPGEERYSGSAIRVEQDRIRYDSLYSLEIVRRVADEFMKQE